MPLDFSLQAQEVFQYFDELSAKQQRQILQLGPIYNDWNNRLNLISRQDIQHLYVRHVLHALSIAQVVAFQPQAKVLDVGTGGGFPAIPLAILFPHTRFHLVDSIGKKVQAVQQIAHTLGVANVTTAHTRAASIKDRYDFILGRAVTRLGTFYTWVKDNISPYHHHPIPNGILYLQGPVSGPLPSPHHHVYPLREFFQAPFFYTKYLVHLYR